MHLFVYSTRVKCVFITCIWLQNSDGFEDPAPALWEPTCYSIKPYIQVVIYDFAKHVFNLHKVHFGETKSRHYLMTMFFSGYKHNVPRITAKYKDKNLDPLNSLPWTGLPLSGVEESPSSDLWDVPTVTCLHFSCLHTHHLKCQTIIYFMDVLGILRKLPQLFGFRELLQI